MAKKVETLKWSSKIRYSGFMLSGNRKTYTYIYIYIYVYVYIYIYAYIPTYLHILYLLW